MNIYFSGIGGVGLGPLAEIARDAGHTVAGSDPVVSLTTSELEKSGIVIATDQSGEFLSRYHEHTPIDWLVYTASLPANHPELLHARALGITHITKRDELLRSIVEEKQLTLLAVAGTHGKTTTTSMVAACTADFVVAPLVTRGLAYYLGEGFEIACPSLGAQQQVCGGGAYAEGIGFAVGVDRLMLAANAAATATPGGDDDDPR